jgi:hypothetical protein
MQYVAKALAVNMIGTADRFAEFGDQHVTFHLGDDQLWRDTRYRDYQEFNRRELLDACRYFCIFEDPMHPFVERHIAYLDPARSSPRRYSLLRRLVCKGRRMLTRWLLLAASTVSGQNQTRLR